MNWLGSKKYIIVSVPFNEDLVKHHIECPECKSRFHISFHLRSFSVDSLKHLFKSHNYNCVQNLSVGESKYYYFITPIKRLIASLKGRAKFKFFHELVCPICGMMVNENATNKPENSPIRKETRLKLIQSFWPSRSNYNWHMGLFEINDI